MCSSLHLPRVIDVIIIKLMTTNDTHLLPNKTLTFARNDNILVLFCRPEDHADQRIQKYYVILLIFFDADLIFLFYLLCSLTCTF